MNMEIKAFNTPQMNFKAMKSSQFKSLEYSAMRKFKAPIEKFNGMSDFYAWAAQKSTELAKIDLGGRDAAVQLRRKAMQTDWIQFVQELGGITTPVVLLVLSSIFKGLKNNNSDLPPQLDVDVFERTIEDTKAKVEVNRDLNFDFKKAYIENLREKLIGCSEGWVIIPSRKTDEENYEENLQKLKALSARTWCTKNDKAEEYLDNCDIHIYYEKGSPELGIRVKDGKVYDIVGFENNGKIPQKYLKTTKDYLQEQALQLGFEAQDQMESAEYLSNTVGQVRADIGEAIDKNDVYRIMEYFGFKPEYLEDGKISIVAYMQPRQANFSELGIDENRLFEEITEIRTNASFRNCAASSLKNVRKIGGMVIFAESSILDGGALEEIGGDLYLANSKITKLPNLKSVGGNICVKNSSIKREDLKI